MLGNSLRAIAPHKYSLWLAREAHFSHTAGASKHGFISSLERKMTVRPPVT
jgi:hypothetical protein